MKRCPSEPALVKAYAGAASESLQAHVRSCAGCGERLARIVRDVDLVERTLRAPRPARAPAHAPRWVWAPAAAAVAAAAVVALAVATGPPARVAPGAAPPSDAEVRAAVRDVSSALFLVGEPGAESLSRPSSTAIVQAALAGGWPARSAAGGPER